MRQWAGYLVSVGFWLLAGVCFIAPLAWLMGVTASHPRAMGEAWVDPFRLGLLARTIGYNAAVAAVATLLAVPAAVALGRGRGAWTGGLILLLPVSLLLPSIAFEYGWKQTLRLAGVLPAAQSAGDVARCVWTLAAWLWPVPAIAGALALRRTDVSLFEQAALDGVTGRITLRTLARPMAVAAAVVFVLASQEFAVFEPSGISVVATEVRMVFETGAYASADNPITQFFGSGATGATEARETQAARSAAAVATALPLTLGTAALAAIAVAAARRWSVETPLHAGLRPARVRAPVGMCLAAYGVLAAATGVPIAALVLSLARVPSAARVWGEFSPQMTGSILLAAAAVAVAGGLGAWAVRRRQRALLLLALACFLAGGQMVAIGLIRAFNRETTAWVYDTAVIAVAAYVGRFGWLMLAAAAVTWTAPWRSLREMASVDGASAAQATWRVILPLAWPMLAAAGVLVGALALTEVPATVLLSPQRPQPIVPLLMGWVHLQRYDAMIEGTLLLCALVLLAGMAFTLLGVAAVRAARWRAAK